MIVNFETFQAIVIDSRKSNNTEGQFVIGLNEIQTVLSVAILDMTIDTKQNFNLKNDKICPKPANQSNTLIRLKYFLRNLERTTSITTFSLSNFNYCPWVWILANAKSFQNIEAIQKIYQI